jgi:hypothetical protein
MEIIIKTLEMRGMRREEIAKYFSAISIQNIEYKKFMGEDWKAEVSEETSIGLGSISILVTMVTFYANKETLDRLINAFRMRFLSAGG